MFFYGNNRGVGELGISPMWTLESFGASVAGPDQWPISDTWAYHDWHHGGNGDVDPWMQKIEDQFGAATSLENFERKAQMFNYVDHRAILRGSTSICGAEQRANAVDDPAGVAKQYVADPELGL